MYVYAGIVVSDVRNLHGFSVIVKSGGISREDKQQCMNAIDDSFKKLSLLGYHSLTPKN